MYICCHNFQLTLPYFQASELNKMVLSIVQFPMAGFISVVSIFTHVSYTNTHQNTNSDHKET